MGARADLGVEAQRLALRTAVAVRLWLIGKIGLVDAIGLRAVLEAGIATAEVRVGDHRCHLLSLKQEAAVVLGEVVGVCQKRSGAKLLLGNARLRDGVDAGGEKGLQLIAFVLPSDGVGVEQDLVLGVGEG